jgi:hypothetical protein
MSRAIHERLSPLDAALVYLDGALVGALYRMAIGFWLIPVSTRLSGEPPSGARLLVFLVSVLLLLRLLPALARAVIPFSQSVRAIWFERRQLAKQYDSYQWQKLFWIGLGLSGQLVVSGARPAAWIVLAGVCVVSGLAGLIAWRSVSRKLAARSEGLEKVRA